MPAKRSIGLAMMLAGILLFPLFASRGIDLTSGDDSPLDSVPALEEAGGLGFLPIFDSGESPSGGAPGLDQDTHSAVPTQDLANNSEAYQRVFAPERIVIPAIDLDEPVSESWLRSVEYQGEPYEQWVAPAYGAGWHPTSAPLGRVGNTVLNGHHNAYGEVFRHLAEVEVGDEIILFSGERAFVYRVGLVMTLPEKYQPLETRLDNARWIYPSEDERITLVTCWPYESNTHRVIVVAAPVYR
jgi:LPXTG-site transpeptidase (sortase) family protein